MDRIRRKQRAQEKAHFRQFYSKYAPEELDEKDLNQQPPDEIDKSQKEEEEKIELDMRTLSIKWNKSHPITRDLIERTFAKYGQIDTINILKNNANSALILCSTYETAVSE